MENNKKESINEPLEEEEETYYGSDRYFEDGYEASHVNDYFDEY